MLHSFFALWLGAALGASLRWAANSVLNPLMATLPLGTLAVNWLGGWLMGIALGVFALFPQLGSEWKLLVITGFLGSLTTFSAFSAETAAMIQHGRWLVCLGTVLLHVVGSIGLVFVGLGTANLAKKLLF